MLPPSYLETEPVLMGELIRQSKPITLKNYTYNFDTDAPPSHLHYRMFFSLRHCPLPTVVQTSCVWAFRVLSVLSHPTIDWSFPCWNFAQGTFRGGGMKNVTVLVWGVVKPSSAQHCAAWRALACPLLAP